MVTQSERAVINLSGERVALGPLRRDLIPTYQRWFNDIETSRTQGDIPGPRTIERAIAWYERNATADDANWFTIYERATWQPIGITWLSDFDRGNATGWFAISIGEPAERGTGYGTEVARLMLDFAFIQLGLHNVALEVFGNNPAGIRAYQKAGFTEFARFREAYLSSGLRWDVVLMEAVAGDEG
ncbi:MAG: GNAT family N-acetyltransferase [Vicinamibacterales bacterium]